MPARIEMIGKKFGKLTVLEKDLERTTKNYIYWICQCECGNKKSVRGTSLRAGETKSCGCLQKAAAAKTGIANTKNLLGQRFGKLVVVGQAPSVNNRAHWVCKCDCGGEKVVSSTNLIEHKIQSCGCITYSLGEQHIEECLQANGIRYARQYVFPDLPKRYFDFAIFDENNNLIELIEFDGPQHTDPSYNWYSEDQVRRDREKDQYCTNNGIILVRIPYEYRDKITMELLHLKE